MSPPRSRHPQPSAPGPAAPTRERLLAEAELRARRGGYAGFSFEDLSQAVGIRKASVHHHFPTKEALGVALIQGYSARVLGRLAEVAGPGVAAPTRLQRYVELYRDGLRGDQGCLCAMIASDRALAPDPVQAAVAWFTRSCLEWLSAVLAAGQAEGSLRLRDDPGAEAAQVLAITLGAMFAAMTLRDVGLFETITTTMIDRLRA